MARPIKARAPKAGDLVVGHRVFAVMPKGLPSVPATVVEVIGRSAVVIEIAPALACFGLPRRTRWTWRRSVGAYQQAGYPTRPGVGLALDPRPR